MTQPYSNSVKERPVKFTPKKQNYETSLQYEGMTLQKKTLIRLLSNSIKSIRDKYGVLHDVYCYADSEILANLLNLKLLHMQLT